MRYSLLPLVSALLLAIANAPAHAAYTYRQAVPGLASVVVAPVTPGISNFGAYRAWDDGTFAGSCAEYLSPPKDRAYSGATGDGVYRLTVNGTPTDAYCDMTTDGGGWTLVLNYLHKAMTNPVLSVRNTLPLLGATALGTDESASTTTWGHASPALLFQLPGTTLRFTCKTQIHGRLVDFKAEDSSAMSYFKSGTGAINYAAIRAAAMPLQGHTGYTPAAIGTGFGNQGAYAMTEFPFYANGSYHWGVHAGGTRWECDDYTNGYSYNTHHRIWIH